MQMQQRTLQRDLTDFKQLIEQGKDEITQRWLKAVHVNMAALSIEAAEKPTLGAEKPTLLDCLPLMFEDILNVLELDDSEIVPRDICNFACHGRERARQRLEIKELMYEYKLLREQSFLYLQEHYDKLTGRTTDELMTILRRFSLAIDEAIRAGVNAFVDEQTNELRHLSRTDSLTGLYNHRTFYERLEEELKRAARYRKSLSIVLIDLDNFKSVNDVGGHQFGDHLLVECAGLLRHELRQTDMIFRYGGDEFGIILPETNRKDAHTMMCRLPNAFRKLGAREGAPASFGMSFGVGSHPEDDGTAAHLVQAADERLVKSKQGDGKINLIPLKSYSRRIAGN